MNQKRKDEFRKRLKPDGVYLHSGKGKSLASVFIFIKDARPNKRTSR